MTAMTDAVSFVFVAQTTSLVITSLLVIYPVVAYARNVAHTRGLVLLAAAFLTLTVSYVAWILLGMPVVSSALDLVAALLGAAGIWQFARPFVHFGGDDVENFDGEDVGTAPVGDATGGFESAGED